MTATRAALPDTDCRVVFREPLDSPRWIGMQWRGHGYMPFTLPSLGESTLLRAAVIASLVFHG